MTRHSKQHSSVNSYHERSQGTNSWYDNQWGTQSVREGATSVLEFDHCRVCLHLAKEPVCCPEGHIYCTACIYQFLMNKKLKFKEQMVAFNAQEQKLHEEKEKEEHKELIKSVELFEKTEEDVKSSTVRTAGQKRKAPSGTGKDDNPLRQLQGNDGPLGYQAMKTPRGEVFLVDKSLVSEHALTGLSDDDKKKRANYFPAFWIPHLTPSSKTSLLKKPEPDDTCPFGKPLKRKNLKKVVFTPTPDSASKTKAEKGKWMCPMSRKTLTNTTKMYFIVATGDVVTEESAKIIVKDKSFKGKKVKKKHVVRLKAGGSGFAGGGAKTVKAQNAPVFLYG